MLFNRKTGRMLPALALAGVVAAACTDGEHGPIGTRAEAVSARLSLEASAPQQGRVAVALRAEGRGVELGGVQGWLTFDPAALTYVGQQVAGSTMVLVNESQAARGRLRVLALDTEGLMETAATLVFEARGDYLASLAFEPEMVASLQAEEVRQVTVQGARMAGGLSAANAVRMEWRDWARRFDGGRGGPELALLPPAGPRFSPGQFVPNLRFGDATLNGTLNFTDASYVANVSVGNAELIIGTDAPARDAVVASNVRPVNGTGLGEASDPVPPGREADGSREINLLDALAVAREAVGTDQTIVGELIPGRAPLATNRVSVPAGNITTSTTWTANNVYELQGIVRVNGGATLTIEPGTRVEGLAGAGISALFVERDGMIVADGTPLQPITFSCTAASKSKGCWGGIYVAGNAPLNDQDAALPASPVVTGRSAGGCNQKQGEGGAPTYGGCNATDNSGTLRYLVIEYAGFLLSANNELNGLTLGGVGSGTTVENIQVHAGLDDGVELFGGTVNLKRLYLTANSDDSFDYSFGWNGKAQYIVIQHDSLDSDKGFEVDNTETAATYGATPRTLPTIFNVTFVGPESPTSTSGAANNNSNDAFHIRRGAGGIIRNALVVSGLRALDLDDAATCTAIGTSLVIGNSFFAGVPVLGNTDSDTNPCGAYASATDLEGAFLNDAANANTVAASAAGLLRAGFDVRLPDFRPVAGSAAATAAGATPPSDGFFETAATFVGAVAPASSTGSNIPWYSGWTRGWQSATAP